MGENTRLTSFFRAVEESTGRTERHRPGQTLVFVGLLHVAGAVREAVTDDWAIDLGTGQ